MPTRTPPEVTGTYRLQLHTGFGFAQAREQVPYLARLGVSHLYLSPILTATPGSLHGYDVTDHSRVSADLGGESEFRRLAEAAHQVDLGIVVDLVPNHMAIPAPEWQNAPLWQVLTEGRASSAADWFDVDWAACDDRIGLPLLGDTLESCLAAGELTLAERDGDSVVRYHDHAFPVARGTEDDDLGLVLSRQHYLLASWRESDRVLNYRRFFEVDQLIALRVEDPRIFETTHEVLLRLHHEGLVDGFRIDHPDGLADPEGYLDRLSAACAPGTPIWVEKILGPRERLPRSWRTEGTTGYDALRVVSAALVEPATVQTVDQAWTLAGGAPDFAPVAAAGKRQAVTELLQPETGRLHRRAVQVLPDLEPERLRSALTELLASVDVYRAYVRPGHPTSLPARAHLEDALSHARTRRPDLDRALDRLGEVLLDPDPSDAVACDLAVRFQQTCGPVLAKGLEDGAFYRWHRLSALCEVGGDPSDGQHPGTAALHDWAAEQQRHWPRALTARSTHDTKRSEDVRARILAVSGDATAWQRCSATFAAAAREHGVDGPTSQLVWQTLAGVGPIDRERLRVYLVKAVREAKQHTAWVDGDPDYEQRVIALARSAITEGPLRDALEAAVSRAETAIRARTLATTLVALCLPGVPDTYQGCEVVDLSLVDPDNRRPVDYAARSRLLADLDRGAPATGLAAEKLLVTSRALRLRRRRPEWFGPSAAYTPVRPSGGEAFGFMRAGRVACLVSRGGGTDGSLTLPVGRWRDELTGRTTPGGGVEVRDLLGELPVALLVATTAEAVA